MLGKLGNTKSKELIAVTEIYSVEIQDKEDVLQKYVDDITSY
jgi:hypothetical protein